MKCPKCSYLGFETGDRCKNCGYDFSLLTAPAPRDPDLLLHEAEPFAGTSNQWLEELDRGLAGLQVPAAATARPDPLAPMPLDTVTAAPVTPPLPLFPLSSDDDQPLIKLPAAPRAPLSVRRTPDRPRLRAVPKPVRRGAAEAAQVEADPEPVLQFPDDPASDAAIRRDEPVLVRARAIPETIESSTAGRRCAAMLVDHALLTGIDAVVIYFTLKMAALAPGEWRQLPPMPMLAFLGLVKVAYFYAFTLVGGQTVGKMAAGIRVIGADHRGIDPPRALRRTVAGAASLLTLGLGYLPVFFAADRRALHDRLAQTHVIRS